MRINVVWSFDCMYQLKYPLYIIESYLRLSPKDFGCARLYYIQRMNLYNASIVII